MTILRYTVRAFALFAFIFAVSSAAQAQATRTWVSGVGDDVNPCSRTAPCKTFAGAISKTATGGEIDVLDSGGFGSITITKSITIDGTDAGLGSILATGTTGVVINMSAANANDPERRVTLRRLSINGTGTVGSVGQRTGVRGIQIIAAKAVHVEDCYIQHFVNEGINTGSLAETGTYVSVKNTNIQNCANGINVTTSTGFVQFTLDRVRLEKNTSNGLLIGARGHAYVRDSVIAFNGTGVTGDGISIGNTVTDATVQVESTFIASNSAAGIRNGGTGSIVDISNTSIMQNASGLASSSAAAGGGINSHGNNQIANNTAAGTTPNPVGQQ